MNDYVKEATSKSLSNALKSHTDTKQGHSRSKLQNCFQWYSRILGCTCNIRKWHIAILAIIVLYCLFVLSSYSFLGSYFFLRSQLCQSEIDISLSLPGPGETSTPLGCILQKYQKIQQSFMHAEILRRETPHLT